jgi:fibronectin type 3 domain-containing protein
MRSQCAGEEEAMRGNRFGRAWACLVVCFVWTANALAANPVQTENAKPGTASWQLTSPAQFREIEGYASLTSVNRGGTISLFVNTIAPTYTIEIYRMGWYGGLGGRQVLGPITRTGIQQQIPAPDALGTIECNWVDPFVLTVPNNSADPTDWASGVYLAKLTWGGGGPQSYIIFTVRDDARSPAADYLFQSSVNTWQAYNAWGGKSAYDFNSYPDHVHARKVSFNRPYDRNTGTGDFTGSMSSGWELNMLRFLEREGYDVTYSTDVDLHEQGMALIAPHKAFLSVGHDEYWSYAMKSAVHQARSAGKHLGFFGSNAIYWQIRYEPAKSGGLAANRTLVTYKEASQTEDPLWLDADPSNDRFISVRFRDIAAPPYNVVDAIAQPENGIIGVMYHGDPVYGDIVVADATSWIYAGTGVSNGTHFTGLLGYETDAMFSNGYAPAGLQKVAESPDDFGFSHATVYTAPSGSIVFATGSMQWSWGLDDYNVPNPRISVLDPRVQTTTRNILARFAVAPPPPLLPPAGLQASGDLGKDVLSWSAAANATTYNVYRATASGGEGATPYRTGIASTSFADTTPVAGVPNYYQVTSVNGAAESVKSNEASATPQTAPAPPPAPTNLQASGQVAKIALSWSASASATSYNVYRATTSGGEGATPYRTGISTTSFTDTAPVAGVPNYYQVTGVNAAGEGAKSSEASATPQAAAPPAAPTSVNAAPVGVNIKVTWTQSTSAGITGNKVYRATSSAGPYALTATLGPTTSYTDNTVAKKTTYYYQVTAVGGNASLESPSSATVTVVTK